MLKMGRIVMLHPITKLPTPMNLSMWWNFGSLLGLMLVMQILTGFLLAMHYTADINLAFSSVSHIVREVNGGWMLRSLHANGASFFFICIYLHIGRGLYYGSYNYMGTWITGVVLLLLVMASAFLGYVLPWGQMSFWGATVITNLMSAIPYFGVNLVEWLWGGFSVNNATLTRFFAFHFITPLLIAVMVTVHIILLHSTGSNNPLGMLSSSDKVPFHSYFTIKDIVGFITVLSIMGSIVLFSPNVLSEPDNYIIANPMSTPAHIVPEWYFLFAYAILRSIPNKLGGVLGLLSSILLLLTLPFLNKNTYKGNAFYPMSKVLHWAFVMSFLVLTVAGAWPVEEPYVSTSRFFAFLYFCFFILNLPLRMTTDSLMLYVED